METEELIKSFRQCRVMVVGDLVADEYLYGVCDRLSREAPVPVLKHAGEKTLLGGAANAINNLVDMGAGKVFPIGLLGADSSGVSIMAVCEEKGVDTSGIVIDGYRHTTTKTRVMASGHHTTYQQLVRIDCADSEPLEEEIEGKLIGRISEIVDEVNVLLVSDYGHAVLSGKIIDFINNLAREKKDLIIAVDSRYQLERFHGATVVTPNEPEAESLTGKPVDTDAETESACRQIKERLSARNVILTRGKKGMMTLNEKEKTHKIEVYGSDEIADVTGAGDTVISATVLALAAGADIEEAAEIANHAGGLVVMKNGTATVSQAELLEACRNYMVK
ncbi:MAG: bifunctional heptose 7-phosphate kinase/heptose 1-phosphate adenyltransferase [bacterium]